MKNVNQFEKQFVKSEISSAAAITQFQSTIDQLQKENDNLAKLHSDIEADIEKLTVLKERVTTRVASNQSVINNLDNLISIK